MNDLTALNALFDKKYINDPLTCVKNLFDHEDKKIDTRVTNITIILKGVAWNIRVMLINEKYWIARADLLQAMGFRQSSSIKKISDINQCDMKIKTRGGPQTIKFINRKGILEIIHNTRKGNTDDIFNCLGGSTIKHKFQIKVSHEETCFLDFIQRAFKGDKMIDQYDVDKYKIDLYFTDYKLAIEYDETYHKHQQKKDNEREEYIKQRLGCKFMRFNFTSNVFDAINQIYRHNISSKK